MLSQVWWQGREVWVKSSLHIWSPTGESKTVHNKHRHMQTHLRAMFLHGAEKLQLLKASIYRRMPLLPGYRLAYDVNEKTCDLWGCTVLNEIRNHQRETRFKLLINGVNRVWRSNNLGHHFTYCRQELRLVIFLGQCSHGSSQIKSKNTLITVNFPVKNFSALHLRAI